MKKSMIFAILAMFVYLLSNILMGVFAKSLNLIEDDTQTSFPIKEQFHYLDIAIKSGGYGHLNITEDTAQSVSFNNFNNKYDRPEYKVVNDTLFVKMKNQDLTGYYDIMINVVSLRSVKFSCDDAVNVDLEMNGSVKDVILESNANVNFRNCRIDTLNIQLRKSDHIYLDTCRINTLNFYKTKDREFNFSISRSPLPQINQFEEGIISGKVE